MSRIVILLAAICVLLALTTTVAAAPFDPQAVVDQGGDVPAGGFVQPHWSACDLACFTKGRWKGGYCRWGATDASTVCTPGWTCICNS